AATGQDQFVDALVAAQRRLHRELRGHVGTQAHVGQNLQPFDVVAGLVLGAAEDHPAGAEAGQPVRFGQTVEGDDEQVVAQRGHWNVLRIVIQDLAVDLVREDDQVVLARNTGDLQQNLLAVYRTRGIVRVDDDDRAGVRGDLLLDILDVRKPVRGLVTVIVHGHAARQADGRGPQRVVGGRDQYFIAVVEQRLHRHDDQLADAIAQVNIFDVHASDL